MCGIAGLWAPDLAPEHRAELVAAMVACLAHRGPDGVALWGDDEVTLGLARLAIVDPESPARVFTNEDRQLHAVVNGEIYNHVELARALMSAGHDVPRGPDTAVVVHLYEQHGLDFPRHLDGMFGLAIWDRPRRRLLLARDRAGEKPLFTATRGARVAFASEPAALLSLPWISRRPAPAAVLRYLTHGFFAAPDCAFEDLRQVGAGSLVECDARGERVRHYWRPWDQLGARRAHVDSTSLVCATRSRLERATAARIPSEMPFGVFLSGGLDSSLIAAAAARCGRNFHTFSLALVGHGYDESSFAREVAGRLGSQHHEVTMEHAEGREALDALAATMDQPLGDPSMIPTWYLARFASRHVPVVLTGEGADELFAGYPTYLGHRHAALAERLPLALTRRVIALARRMRPADRHLSIPYFVERFLGTRGLSPFDRHLSWFGAFDPHHARALLDPALAELAPDGAARAHLCALAHELDCADLGRLAAGPELVGYQLFDFVLTLGGGLLTKVDRSTMSHGVESRAPFLSSDVIEWALALPDDVKLRGTSGKWILKEVAKDLVPRRVITRRKRGFSPPFSAWARGPWRNLVREVLAPERVARAGVLDGARVALVVERHLRNEAENGRQLWCLLSLQLWAERWLSSPGRPPESLHPEPRARLERYGVANGAAPVSAVPSIRM